MFTLICARLGDGDLAIPLIERLLRTPHGLGLQDLRFSPDWDPLRDVAVLYPASPPERTEFGARESSV